MRARWLLAVLPIAAGVYLFGFAQSTDELPAFRPSLLPTVYTHSIEVRTKEAGMFCLNVEGALRGPTCREFRAFEVGVLEVRSTIGEEAAWDAWSSNGGWARGRSRTVTVKDDRKRPVRRP